jgi:hypothetical protein
LNKRDPSLHLPIPTKIKQVKIPRNKPLPGHTVITAIISEIGRGLQITDRPVSGFMLAGYWFQTVPDSASLSCDLNLATYSPAAMLTVDPYAIRLSRANQDRD